MTRFRVILEYVVDADDDADALAAVLQGTSDGTLDADILQIDVDPT